MRVFSRTKKDRVRSVLEPKLALSFPLKWPLPHQTMPKSLMDDAEGSLFAIGQMQFQIFLSVFAADLSLRLNILPTSIRQPAKRGLFRGRLLLVYRSGF
jgi:hypothetical protein